MHNGAHPCLRTGIVAFVGIISSAAVLFPAPGADAAVAASRYHYSRVVARTPSGKCANAGVYSMTNRGVMLGIEYCTSDRSSRGFVKRGSKFTVFKAPGSASGTDTEPSGISNNGRYIAVDTQQGFSGPYTGYLKTASGYQELSDPNAGPYGTQADGVNDNKEVVGAYYLSSSTQYQAFIYQGGKFTTFQPSVKNARDVALTDVNDHGDLAGYYQDSNNRYHGFVVISGHFHAINAPGAGKGTNLGTQVLTITPKGNYCGDVLQRHGQITSSTYRGFIHRNGRYTSVKVPSSFGHDTDAAACDDSGTVAGDYIHTTGTQWERMAYAARP